MTKPRTQAFRLLPPTSPHLQVTARQCSYRDGEPSLGQYELRPANTVAACPTIPLDRLRLINMMEQHRFGVDELPTQHQVNGVDRALSDLSRPDLWLSKLGTNRRPGPAFIFEGWTARGLDRPVSDGQRTGCHDRLGQPPAQWFKILASSYEIYMSRIGLDTTELANFQENVKRTKCRATRGDLSQESA
jgi:hypothetical protein